MPRMPNQSSDEDHTRLLDHGSPSLSLHRDAARAGPGKDGLQGTCGPGGGRGQAARACGHQARPWAPGGSSPRPCTGSYGHASSVVPVIWRSGLGPEKELLTLHWSRETTAGSGAHALLGQFQDGVQAGAREQLLLSSGPPTGFYPALGNPGSNRGLKAKIPPPQARGGGCRHTQGRMWGEGLLGLTMEAEGQMQHLISGSERASGGPTPARWTQKEGSGRELQRPTRLAGGRVLQPPRLGTGLPRPSWGWGLGGD